MGYICGPCINEMPDLQELFEDVKESGGSIIGIIGDTQMKIMKLQLKNNRKQKVLNL